MVPNFALSLSFEGISLLRHIDSGWARIADVALSEADLDAAMNRLRDQAATLDPATGTKVLLILPNEQIRYLDLPDTGADARDATARTALDGATPYSIEELAFDHSTANGRLYVAAVARETLEEAESFARQYGFVPQGFAANAPDGSFDGAVWFGAAEVAGRRNIKRPTQAFNIVDADEAALTPVSEPEPTEPATAPSSAELAFEESATDRTETGSVEPEPQPVAETASPEADTPKAPQENAAHAALQANAAQKRADVPTFSSHRNSRDDAQQPPHAKITATREQTSNPGPVKPRFTPVASAPTKPTAKPQPDAKAPTGPAKPKKTEKGTFAGRLMKRRERTEPKLADQPQFAQPAPKPDAGPAINKPADVPAEPKTPPLARTAQQDDSRPTTPPAPTDAPKPKPRPLSTATMVKPAGMPPPPEPPKVARPGGVDAPATSKSSVGALSRLGKMRAKPKAEPTATKPIAVDISSTTSDEERNRLTVFGERNRAPVGGKPRFLGLMLTIGLLVVLVGVAAWASVFLDDGLARLFRSDREEPVVATVIEETTPTPTAPAPGAPETASAPAIATENEVTANDETAQEAEEDLQIAALEVTPDTAAPTTEPLSQTAEPRVLTPQEADTNYAATGIWQRSPTGPRQPPLDGVDDVYVASIDPAVQPLDAVALPAMQTVAPEAALTDPGLPPPAGMTFDFDARGLVRATDEGALSPDGLRIYTGRPPVVPPLRQAALPAPATATDGATDDASEAAVPPAGQIRPEARPDDLLEIRERATLGGISVAELEQIRPVLRPRTAQEQAQEEEPEAVATAQAIGRSLVPVTRPRNMTAIVERAETQREAQEIRTAAVAPRTVQPTAPSAASVERAATVRNAINLSRIALIGIYGSPSNRRALVRLPNGRYEKVKAGDRLDGGRVTAIGESDLRYQKGGRNITLDMPRG